MSKICSSCNTENVDEAKFCRKCGFSFINHEAAESKIQEEEIEEVIECKKQEKETEEAGEIKKQDLQQNDKNQKNVMSNAEKSIFSVITFFAIIVALFILFLVVSVFSAVLN